MDPIWYVGPPGLLRPVFCPEQDVDVSVERFGGVHQTLSGARTMDVTGRRQTIRMSWNHLETSDYKWLRALNLGELPGPYRMISPLSKNRLTPEASLCKVASGTRRGWYPAAGIGTRVFDYPSALSDASDISMSTKWTNRLTNVSARWDNKNLVTVLPGETVTMSVYTMATSVISIVHFGFDWYDRSSVRVMPSSDSVKSASTGWTRWDFTATAPAGATMARPYLYTADVATDLWLAAAQVEAGSSATSWEVGGGAPVVLLDQLSDVSPIFGLNNVSATFLEA